MDPLIIAICWLAGSAIIGIIGWMNSSDAWNTRKFMSTILGGVSGAIVFGLAYQYTGASLTVLDYLTAIAAGMGVGAAVPRISGAIASRSAKLPPHV